MAKQLLRSSGARPIQLIRQFLGESFLLILIALLIAAGVTAVSIPLVNRTLSTHLDFGGWNTVLFLIALLPVIALGGGLYPAFILSRFAPVKVLKGSAGKGKGFLLRRALTVIQFVIALAMLTGTAVIYSQMDYITHKDLGVDRDQVTGIGLPASDSLLQGRSAAFCEALRHISGIGAISIGSGLPSEGASLASMTAWSDMGKKREMSCRFFFIDPQFLPLLKISLAAGRNLSDSLGTDKAEAFLVNESFVSKMGWKQAIGQRLEVGDKKGRVVGVVRNFIYSSLHNAIEPIAMVYPGPSNNNVVLMRLPANGLSRAKEIWKDYFPDRPIDYIALDKDYMEQYKKDKMMMILFNGFSILAIFISCLGLYGLVSLITIQRTKEIGIRKVLGASLLQLVTLQSKDQVQLVGLAALVALPLAGIGGQRWLASYAWHTQLSVWIFIWPLLVIALLALVITGIRVTRASLANPTESLRAD